MSKFYKGWVWLSNMAENYELGYRQLKRNIIGMIVSDWKRFANLFYASVDRKKPTILTINVFIAQKHGTHNNRNV